MPKQDTLREKFEKWHAKDYGQDGEIGFSPSVQECTDFWLKEFSQIIGGDRAENGGDEEK